MNEKTHAQPKDKIFATGVFLQAVKCKINEKEQWRWVAVGFEDDIFYNGEIINPVEYADEVENLTTSFDENME